MQKNETQMEKSGYWRASLVAFKSSRAIAVSGMLLGVHLVLSMALGIYLTQSVKFSLSFVTNVITGWLYGPWMALLTGALGDILQYILKPVGGYFFGWTLSAAIGGLLYGLAFFQKSPAVLKNQANKKVNAKNDAKLLGYSVGDFVMLCFYIAGIVGCFKMNFLDVTTKVTEENPVREIMNSGTVFAYLTGNAGTLTNQSPKSLAIAAVVFLGIGIVLCVAKKRVFTILLNATACLWMMLPVYTDRKVLSAGNGFILLCVVFAAGMIAPLVHLLLEQEIDVKFMLRCFLVMLIIAVVVQMGLGTYWCTVMYGKGFWFYFVPRAMKSLIQLPFNTVLVYYVIRSLKRFRPNII